MKLKPVFLIPALVFLAACGGSGQQPPAAADRIVSLDYCADQYVLGLVDRQKIAALSPDAEASFSYLRDEARGLKKVRPRAEDILLLNPDIVVRTYGGGVNITALMERAGIDVVQIGYANDLAGVQRVITETAAALQADARGAGIVADTEQRLAALPSFSDPPAVLYLTSKGATAGRNTMIDDLIARAGLVNYREQSGWTGSIPLEELVSGGPDLVATGFFETSDLTSDLWTPTRHPVAQRFLASTPAVNLPGAWTSCGAWPLVDAVEALSARAEALAADGTAG